MKVTRLHSLLALTLLAAAVGAGAQDVDESALDALEDTKTAAVIQSAEPAGAAQLRAAMRRIANSPTDADALADAGNAALTLGDANAALNFLTRANGLRPNNGRIVSALAIATVRTENPFEALKLFDDAVRLGVSERTIAADRGLAFDLLGNFTRAQQDYRLARSAALSDDLVIRQAISMSLKGQKSEADALLVPLLQRNNVAAWRARALMLAARGDFRESAKVTQGFMDQTSAQRMERYLRLMPELTGAQQAAAIHLGHFPASQYVGRDSEQVRRVAAISPTAEPARGGNRLVPTGAPLGTTAGKTATEPKDKKGDSKRSKRARDQEDIRIATANIPEDIKLPKTDRSRLGTETARAAVEQARMAKIAVAQGVALPPPETARPLVKVATTTETVQLPPAVSVPIATAAIPSPQAAAPSASASDAALQVAIKPEPGFTAPDRTIAPVTVPASTVTQSAAITGAPVEALAAVQAAALPSVPVQGTASPAPASASAFDLAAVVSAIKIPESEQRHSAVPVDLRKIKPTLPKIATADNAVKSTKPDPKAAKAKAEATNPARYWVQIATGQASALPFDYRKWSKKSPELFKKQEGWTAQWGKTSRLLIGPFADMKAAKKWETDFKKAGGDSFAWKSEPGEEVVKLKAK